MKHKSLILSILALVLIVCAVAQPALAYFTANTDANGAVPLRFGRSTWISEEVTNLRKAVTITNTGGETPDEQKYADPVWVRARAYVGQEYSLSISGEDWSGPDAEEWYYYADPVPPPLVENGVVTKYYSTKPLYVELTDLPKVDDPEHQFTDINVAVVYESITAVYNPDGVTFKPYVAKDWTEKLDSGSTSSSGS